MTWYTSMCGIMAIGLLYKLTLWSMCVWRGGGALDPWLHDQDAAIPNGWSLDDGRH